MSRLRIATVVAVFCTLAACSDESSLVGPATAFGPTTARVSATPPTTEAPDLVSVTGFTSVTQDGVEYTRVAYEFDQPAYLNGGNRSSFSLVPLDASDALDGTGIEPDTDADGDNVVEVFYNGAVAAADYARGVVATGVVNSDCCNVGPANPANVNQSAIVSNGGLTENPDVVSVTRDGDQVFFEFDQPLTDDDVVQNTSGLRVYFPQADQTSTIPDAGALAVKRDGPTTLRAFYGDDLPISPDGDPYTLDEAVGGFVAQGTVQGVQGSRGGNDGKNAFDELAPLGDTGAVVCEAAPETGQTGDRTGPTEAPDLLDVGNFRRGPFTDGFEPTTCVDFVFDQPAYLKGTRSNFNLVPLDASDALPGSTNQTPEADRAGDRVVTVVFPGDLSPEDFARGYVDTGVVNSAPTSPTASSPLNINQAANVGPNTTTENPDLVQDQGAVNRKSNVWLTFTFDEPLTDDDVVQSTSGLRIYFPATSQSATIPSAGAVKVKRVDANTVRAKFKDLPEGYRLSDAVGAYVVQGTVQAAVGSRGGNDGKSAFDESFLSIDFPGGS